MSSWCHQGAEINGIYAIKCSQMAHPSYFHQKIAQPTGQ
ncbi:hypothetical protein Q7O_000721 [Pectobacterium carotovorum subsp. carotovorum PCCS1]|nr:hypothetical protein [Pectobacterium carotovorum subsp. carotovorum PCCS1]